MAKTENKKDSLKKENNKTSPIKKPNNASLSLEITSVLIVCFGVLLIIGIFFGSGGFLGRALSSLFKGLFGIGAYFLPIIMIGASLYIFFSESRKINIFKAILSIIAFIILISFFHIITRQDITNFSSYFGYLANEYETGKFLDGGVLGALFGDLLVKIIGTFASYIVLILLFIVTIFLLTGKSFFSTISDNLKNVSNYFYKLKDEKIYKDENNNKLNIFSKIKEKIYDLTDETYYEDDLEEEQPPPPPISKRTPKKLPNPDMVLENREDFEIPRRTIKRYDNYIFDGVDKYKRVERAVFFDMNKDTKPDKDRKIRFAIDEINNPEKYENNKNLQNISNNQNILNDINIKNENIIQTNENIIQNNNLYSTTANMVKNFEKDINKTNNDDLFKVQSKENYFNDVYKKKKTDNIPIDSKFNIDLKFANSSSIDDIFEKPPEQFLSNNVETSHLSDLDNFYSFDDDIEKENTMPFSPIQNNQIVEQDTIRYEPILKNNENINNSEKLSTEDENINDNERLSTEDENVNNNERLSTENKNINDNEELLTEDKNINNNERLLIEDDEIEENNINRGINSSNKYDNNSSYSHINKDNEGFTIINQNEDKKELLQNIDKKSEKVQNIEEPIIIRPDVEKMVNKLDVEQTAKKDYVFPQLSFLAKNCNDTDENNDIELRENSYILVKTLKSFNVNAQVINISKGPSVTRYELSIEDGIKVSKILGLADNLALSLAASSIRIEAPIPGKSAVGIEIPNKEVKSVFLSEVICAEKFQKFPSKVAFGLGKDITGNVIVTDIAKMPHMLIAGATGSGKSVCINTLITSILYKANPEEVKLMMIDPKVVELSVYNGIPHLLTPVVTEPEKAAGVLNWAVSEMMERYNLFAQTGTRNLVGYNSLKEENNEPKLPQIVIIIDELADLMMVAAKEVEASICRLAQLARAAGIHLIIATQRPSVDVITGLIKANIPSRIAFAVSSGTDSRTVLDTVGAEKLLGKGDMLFRSVDMNKPLRIQGAFISDKEVENIVTFIKENSCPNYDESIINKIESSTKSNDSISSDNSDELTEDVIAFLVKKGKASTSMIQRQFRIGYNRAARIIEELEDRGIVSSENGSKQRDVLMDRYQYEEYLNRYNNY
nr:DNA translocase FtsK 4TM domain-containing protein [uncultured Tyzzerella sp.]